MYLTHFELSESNPESLRYLIVHANLKIIKKLVFWL